MDNLEMIQEHPGIGSIRKEYEVQISELEEKVKEVQELADDRGTKLEDAEWTISSQSDLFRNITQVKGADGKLINKESITLSEFKDKVKGLRLMSCYREWDLTDDLLEALNKISPSIEYHVETKIEIREILPKKLKINGVEYNKN